MVSTRVVIIAAVFVVFLALGSDWIAFESGGDGSSTGVFGIAESINYAYGPCNCPPATDTIDGQFWLLFLPNVIAPGAPSLSLVAYSAALVLGVASIFRWKLMSVAGLLALASGVLWILGVDIVQNNVAQGLDSWHGYGGRAVVSSVWSPIGPYFAAAGGLVLVVGYFLSRAEKLDYPID